MDPATTQATAKAVEETAKTAGKGLDIVHDTGGYLRQVFGDVPTDLVGVVGGAWLHEFHMRLRDKLQRRTEQILRDRNVQEVIELSPNVAAALISGAQEEAREELAELWARLLANAMDPNLNDVRRSFIDAVKNMDPPDALIIHIIEKQNLQALRIGREKRDRELGHQDIAQMIYRKPDEVEVSFRHLEVLRFLDAAPNVPGLWYINALCREFIRACYPETGPK